MHLLRRNIGCYLLPDVSTAPLRYIVPLLSLYFRFPQSSRLQEVTGTGKMALSDGVTLKYWAPFFGN